MRYLFVVSHGRSGSTALQKVLNGIEGYCIRGESGGLYRHLFLAIQAARETRVRSPEVKTSDHAWYGAEAIDPASFEKALTSAFVQDVLSPPPGTRVVGFKEIRYLPLLQRKIDGVVYRQPNAVDDAAFAGMMEHLCTGFGEGRVILLSRDPERTAQSGWWANRDPATTLPRLRRTVRRFDKAAADWPDQSFRLRHESFADDPEGLRPLLDWLGEEMPPEQLASLLSHRLTHAQAKPKAAVPGAHPVKTQA